MANAEEVVPNAGEFWNPPSDDSSLYLTARDGSVTSLRHEVPGSVD